MVSISDIPLFSQNIQGEDSIFHEIIWTLIFITFSGLTCYILINNVISYYQFNVVSTIQVVSERESVFPAMTICNSNPFTTKYAENLTYELALNNLGIKLDQVSLDYYNKNFAILGVYVNSYVNDPSFDDTNRKLLGNFYNK